MLREQEIETIIEELCESIKGTNGVSIHSGTNGWALSGGDKQWKAIT